MYTLTVSDNTRARLESIQKALPAGARWQKESFDSVISRLLDEAGVPKEV